MIAQETNDLLQDLARSGIILAANGGELQVKAPRGVMTQALRSEIRKHKAALLAALQSNEPERALGHKPGTQGKGAPTPPPWAGQRVKIEDLPEFKARWGLQANAGAWPEDAPCPRLGFQEAQAANNGPNKNRKGNNDRWTETKR